MIHNKNIEQKIRANTGVLLKGMKENIIQDAGNELGSSMEQVPTGRIPTFSQALETIRHVHLDHFFDTNNLVRAAQFGFRKNRSTELALLHQKESSLSE